MAWTLPKLFRRSPDTRSIASLLYSQYPKFIQPLTIRPQILLETETSNCDASTFCGQKADELTRLQSSLFCPSFPFGFYLNPISSNGFIESKGNYDVPSYSETVWADSVKKKRKKKINKHKYMKLRKRIRRQTEVKFQG